MPWFKGHHLVQVSQVKEGWKRENQHWARVQGGKGSCDPLPSWLTPGLGTEPLVDTSEPFAFHFILFPLSASGHWTE